MSELLPARIGRPPEPVPEAIANALCEWLGEGKTLRSFCRQPGMPRRATIDSWRQNDDVFASRVARARDKGYEAMAEEVVAIADNAKSDSHLLDGGVAVQRAKLRVETRLKLLACWDPRRYGQKAQIEHSGTVSLEHLVAQTAAAHVKPIDPPALGE